MRTILFREVARLIFVVGFCGPALVFAQSQRDSGFDITQLEPSARAAAMAGAVDALGTGDPVDVLLNPALLTPEASGQISLGYIGHLAGINAGTAAYARNLDDFGLQGIGTAAIAVRFLSYGSIDRTTPDGTTDGSFHPNEASISLALSHPVNERFRVGGTAGALFASIDDASAQALTLGAGATYELPNQLLTFSASLRNVGTVLSSLGETDDRLPVDLRLSVAKGLEHLPFTITLTGYDLFHPEAAPDSSVFSDVLRHLEIGGQVQIGSVLQARVGFHPRRNQELRSDGRLDLAGITAGFGLSIRKINIDYAYNGWSRYGGTHQFGVRFGL